MTVRPRYDPDGPPLAVYAVQPPTAGDLTWRVLYGQGGPPAVLAGAFDTEDEAWAHAKSQGFPRPPGRYPVTEKDSE